MNLGLEKVRVEFGSRKLFEIPAWKIAAGSRVLIEGPSGRGKTTLLHLFAGLLRPTAGTVLLGEHHLELLTDDQLCRLRREYVGLIFQKLNLIEHLTCLENVMLSMGRDSQDEKAAKVALDRVGLLARCDDRSAVLSLGEQQRVAIARVLARPPAIILADEPTSSLDDSNARAIMEALLEATGNRTLIVVSHDQRIKHYFKTSVSIDQWVHP